MSCCLGNAPGDRWIGVMLDDQLVSAMYDAASDPALWSNVGQRLLSLTGGVAYEVSSFRYTGQNVEYREL